MRLLGYCFQQRVTSAVVCGRGVILATDVATDGLGTRQCCYTVLLDVEEDMETFKHPSL
jgi:hypothetical protein